MGRFMALCAGIIAISTLVPAAWSQEAPTPEDPMAQALTAVKSPASTKMSVLQQARNYLVDQRQTARGPVVELLGSADILVRMNAAIILTGMAKAGDASAATLQALQTAATDKEFAVAYWGFMGLMSDGVPAADQGAVIAEMMKMERPRALRLAALTTLGERKPKPAAPIIVSHLQEILKEYKEQRETLVTSAETLPQTGPESLTRQGTGMPGSMYAPPPAFPTGAGSKGPPPSMLPAPGMIPGPGHTSGAGAGAGAAFRGMPVAPPTGPGVGAMPPAAPPPTGRGYTGAPDISRGVPPGAAGGGMAPPMEANRPEMPTGPAVLVRRLDLPNMTLDQLQALAQSVEALQIVAEVHQMGLVLEDIVASAAPGTPLFDFKSSPPWDLDKCVDKAVIYMNAHRAEYGALPEAPKPAAPAVAPAAPPATKAAPATTAASPASTAAPAK